MKIFLSEEDLVEAIRSYTTKMIISGSNIEVEYADELPSTITLGMVDDTPFEVGVKTDTAEPETVTPTTKTAKADKPKKAKKPTKAEKAATDEAIAKLGMDEIEVPDPDDIVVPEASQEVDEIVASMEGKTAEKTAPTKKRMFGQ